MLGGLATMLRITWPCGCINTLPVQEEAAAAAAAGEKEEEDCSEARQHSGDGRGVGKEGEAEDENSGEPRTYILKVAV